MANITRGKNNPTVSFNQVPPASNHRFYLYSAVHTERTRLYRRTIVPLQDWERDNHLFWIPDDVTKFGPYEGIVPENKSTLPPVENPNVAVPSLIAQSLPPTDLKLYNAKEAMVS